MPKRTPGSTLTDKEKMFCTEYLIDLDATNAAIRAGYSEDSATSTAYHLKQRPAVEAYISQLMDERSLRLRITADQVLLELAKIAFAEVAPLIEEDTGEEEKETGAPAPNTTPKKEMSEVDRKTMEYFKRQDAASKPSADKYTAATACTVVYTDQFSGKRSTLRFSLSAKIAALKILAKHLGLFEKNSNAGRDQLILIRPTCPENWRTRKEN
jgi:phage terminase small subunit